jgi:hypothetical protein
MSPQPAPVSRRVGTLVLDCPVVSEPAAPRTRTRVCQIDGRSRRSQTGRPRSWRCLDR